MNINDVLKDLPDQYTPYERTRVSGLLDNLPDQTPAPEAVHMAASQENPEKFAQADVLAEKFKTDPAIILPNIDTLGLHKETPDFNKIMRDNPVLNRWLSKYNFQAQAHDDFNNLSWLEQTFKIWNNSWKRGTIQDRIGLLRAQEREKGGILGNDELIAQLKGKIPTPVKTNGLIQYLAQFAGEFGPIALKSTEEGAKYGMVTSMAAGTTAALSGPAAPVASPAAAAAGFGAGAAYGTYKTFSRIEQGLAYDKMIEKKIPREVAGPVSDAVGIINGLISISMIGDIASMFPGTRALVGKSITDAALRVAEKAGAKKLAESAAKSAVAKVGSVVGGKALDLAAHTATQTTQMVLMEAARTLGDEYGIYFANTAEGTNLKHESPEQIVRRLRVTAENVASGFLLLGLLGSSARSVVDRYSNRINVEIEKKQADALEAVAKASGQTKLFKRNPELFKKVINELNQNYGSLPSRLYLPGDKLHELFTKDGVITDRGREVAKKFKKTLPDLEGKIFNHDTVGLSLGDVVELHQEPEWKGIRDDLQASPFFSDAEASDATQQRVTELFQEMQGQDLSEPAARFKSDLAATVKNPDKFKKKNGITPEQWADTNARVLDSMARVYAENTGATPDAYWNRLNLRVRSAIDEKNNQLPVDLRDAFNIMVSEAKNSQSKGTTVDQNGETHGFAPSTPDWMKQLNADMKQSKQPLFSRNEIENLVRKLESGKDLTVNQQQRFSYLEDAAKKLNETHPDLVASQGMQYVRDKGFTATGAMEVTAGNFRDGEKFYGRVGDTEGIFTTSEDADGNIVVTDEHGGTTTLDPFDRVVVEGVEPGKNVETLFQRENEFAQPRSMPIFKAIKNILDNPNFRKWFGKSKVVDETGKPLVVYHGTKEDFNIFDHAKIGSNTHHPSSVWGFAFTPDKEYAKGYSYYGKEFSKVKEVYLSLQNPKIITFDKYNEILDSNEADRFKADVIKQGHDGIVIKPPVLGENNPYSSRYKSGIYEAFAFEPTQIKSIYNTGEFNPENPDILHQRENRTPWPADFPNIATHTTVSKMKAHADYKAAKAGDEAAAARLISDLIKPDKIKALHKQFPDAVVVAPHAEEAAGRNAIPRMMAEAFEDAGFKVNDTVVQTNVVDRTHSNNLLRLAVRPEFEGKIEPGRDYIIVDDTAGQGGTMSELRYYIESHGGHVVAVSTLTTGRFAAKLSITNETIGKLASKFGRENVEQFIQEFNTAGTIEALTEKEARTILASKDLDSLRNRILKSAREKGIELRTREVQTPVREVKPLQQSTPSNIRGSIAFKNTEAILSLFESADTSTVLHEVGHIFRRDLETMASAADAPDQVRADWQTINEWVGVRPGEAWTREHEEKFAEAWEQYFMEGKAPSLTLRRVFSRFRNWLLAIYKGIRRSWTITPEVRGVFDRALATQDEINYARDVLELEKSLTKDDVPSDAWQDYVDLANQADAEAQDWMQQQRTKARREKQRTWNREAKNFTDNHPIVQARKDLRASEGLSIDDVRQAYSKQIVSQLMKKAPGTLKKAGLPLDVVADQYGMAPGEFIKALLDTPTKKDLIREFIADRQAQSDAEITPDDAVMSDARMRLVDKEIELIGKKLKKYTGKTVSDALARHIRKELRAGRVEDLDKDVDTLLASIRREGKEARKAIREARKSGKDEEYKKAKDARKASREAQKIRRDKALQKALEAKQRQRERMTMLREKKAAAQRAELIRRQLVRIGKQKNIHPEYTEQIHALLAPYDLAPRTYKAIRERESLRAFLDRHRADGEVVDIPDDFAELASKIHPKEMSLDDLEELYSSVKQIAHLGKIASLLVAGQKAFAFKEVKRAMIDRAIEAKKKVPEPLDHVPLPGERKKTKLDTMIENGHAWLADLRRVEFILNAIDGNYKDTDARGPWWESIFRPIYESENAELTWSGEVIGRLDEIFRPIRDMGKAKLGEKTVIDDWQNGNPITYKDRLMIALNCGNEGNKNAIRYGFSLVDEKLAIRDRSIAEAMADRQIQAVLNSLSESDWKFVRNIWTLLEDMYPRINEAHKALTGQELKRVEPIPVKTASGTIPGGYFPLVFDRELSYKADVYGAQSDTKLLFESLYARPTPKHSHRMERVGSRMPPDLNFHVISNHIQQAIHDATHAVAVRDAYKLIQDPEIRQTVIDLYGKATYNQLMPWLQWVANPIRPRISGPENTIRYLRNSTTLAMLSANLGTMMAQPMSITQTVDALGVKPVARGFASFVASPIDTIRKINELSPMMANRRKGWQREFTDMLNQLNPDEGGIKHRLKKAQELLIYTISLGDYVGSYPSWLAAYTEGLKTLSEADAVTYADRIVRTTQPASMAKDLPAIMRTDTGELKKTVTMFYGFFSVFQNRMHNMIEGVKEGHLSTTDLAKGILWTVMVPPVLMQIFKYRGAPDDKYLKDQYLKDLISFSAGGVPLVRDVIGSAVTGFDYTPTPLSNVGKEAARTFAGVLHLLAGKPDKWEKTARYTLKDIGYVTGLPTNQVLKTIDGIMALQQGRTNDYLRPIMGKKRSDWRKR